MRIEIRARNVELTEFLRAHVDRRLGFALGRFGDWIGHVIVRFSDTNGPHRGGVDKKCQININLRPSANVRIEDTDTDWFTTVDCAANRAGRAVARTLALARERELLGRFPRKAAR